MSHIPSIEEENRVLEECGQIHRQLDYIDNPFSLYVQDSSDLPPPLVEGQLMHWDSRTRKHGPIQRREILKAIKWDGHLRWAVHRPGSWL